MKMEDTFYWQRKKLSIEMAKLCRKALLEIKPYLMPIIIWIDKKIS